MSKMNITDAAEYFGVSKEAIHNRVRRGSLSSVTENGVKLVVIDTTKTTTARTQTKRTTAVSGDRYYKLLEEQNAKLQSRVDVLEDETRSLRDQKEEMLIQERIKIEQIYRDKDEQLKNILSSISSKFMLNAPEIEVEEEHVEVEVEPIEPVLESQVISLKKYLKRENISDKKSAKIKKRFDKKAQKDNRIIIIGKKYYLDLAKYDYKDLF